MAIVFWDRKGMPTGEFMQQGTTITLQVYCKTVQKLHRALQNKRSGMLTSDIVLLHDSVLLHTAARTRALLEHFNWELFDHPSYSPDLTLSNYHLFTYLKNWFRSQPFKNNEELMEDVKKWLGSQAADFLHTDIQKLNPQYKSASILAVTTLRSSLSMYK
jgi:transposase